MKKALVAVVLVALAGVAVWWFVAWGAGPRLDASVRDAADRVPGNVAWIAILPPMGELDAVLENASVAVDAVAPRSNGLTVMEADRREALGIDPAHRGVVGQLAGAGPNALFAMVRLRADAPALDDALTAGWPHAEIGPCESPLGDCRTMGAGMRAVLDGRTLYVMVNTPDAHDALVAGLDAPLGDDPGFRETMRFGVDPLVAGYVRPAAWVGSSYEDLPRWIREAANDSVEAIEDLEGMGIALAREPGQLVAEATFWSSPEAPWLGVWDGRRSGALVDALPGRADAFFHLQMDMGAFEQSVQDRVEGNPEMAEWVDDASRDAGRAGVDDPWAIFDVLSGEVAGVSLRGDEGVLVVGLADAERASDWLDEKSEGLVSGLSATDVDDVTVYRTRLLGLRLAAAVIDDRLWLSTMPVLRDVIRDEREPLGESLSPAARDAVDSGAPFVASLRPVRVLDGLDMLLPVPAMQHGEALLEVIDDVIVTSGAEGRFTWSRVCVRVNDERLDAWVDESRDNGGGE